MGRGFEPLQARHYGGYSSVVERQIVALDVVGSSPTSHPTFLFFLRSAAICGGDSLRWGVAKW